MVWYAASHAHPMEITSDILAVYNSTFRKASISQKNLSTEITHINKLLQF